MRPVPVAKGRTKSPIKKKVVVPKPKKVPNETIKKAKVAVKRVKKPNEKFKKKVEVIKKEIKIPKRGEEGGPPTLCETFSRLTTMVAETVINEKAGFKVTDIPVKPKPDKPKKRVKTSVPVKKGPSKAKIPVSKVKSSKLKKPGPGKKKEKSTLDKSESLVKGLKDVDIVVTCGKGIGTRRKSISHSDDKQEEARPTKCLSSVNSASSKAAKSAKKATVKPKIVNAKKGDIKKKAAVKRVTKCATQDGEKKPKKSSQSKSDEPKSKVTKFNPPKKIIEKKVKIALPNVKKEKKRTLSSETEGSNSDEVTLNVLKKQAKKVKVEPLEPFVPLSKVKLELLHKEAGAHSETSRKLPKKKVKIEKEMVEVKIEKESTTDSEDDLELRRLLAKKFPKSKPPLKKVVKKVPVVEPDQRAKRLRLFGFWSGPKKHRVASLNALAKVHCLYENESKSALSEVEKFSAPKGVEKSRKCNEKNEQMTSVVINKRTLRGAPGTRAVGKHWEQGDSTSSVSSDESPSDSERRLPLQPSYRQKMQKEEAAGSSVKAPPKRRRKAELGATMDLKDMVVRKRMASLNASAILAASYSFEKRGARKGSSATSSEDGTTSYEEGGSDHSADTKSHGNQKEEDCRAKPRKSFWKTKVENLKKEAREKRNSPSPILADFGVEKNVADKVMEKEHCDELHGGKKMFKSKGAEKTKRKMGEEIRKINIEKIGGSDEYEYKSDSDSGQKKLIELRNAGGSNKKVAVIVNQDTDVTITGVYVNSTRSTHHEGFCNIAGMQYRISSTSHTQTEATAVLNTSTASEQPSPAVTTEPPVDVAPSSSPRIHKSYTPLSALSSMQPPAAHAHVHHHHCGLGPPQGPVSPLGHRAGCSSAFSAPPCSTAPPDAPPPPPARDMEGPRTPHGGYYQPAGPLIQPPPAKTQGVDCGTREVPPSRGIEEPPENPPPMGYTRSFPPYQGSFYPGYYPPPPPQPAHYQPPQPTSFHQHYHHHQELCYPPGYPPGSYPPPSSYRRYLAPSGYHPPDLTYSSSSASSAPPPSEHPVQQMVVPGGSNTYPPPLDHYPHPPSSGYCPGYPSGPTAPCYSHPPSGPSRNLPFMETTYQSCPCPMQSCPKNVHTGPLTGECKRSGALPLPPVALALPKEPPGATGPPSPARGSAGVAPLPSAAGNWPAASPGLPPGPPAGLLAISETAAAANPASPPAKRKLQAERVDGSPMKKRTKRSNENAGIDKKPPRKELDPTVLKDRNVETAVSVTEVPPLPDKEMCLDTVIEVIEDVVRGRISKSNSPPILERVRDVCTTRRRKTSPKPPTLTPAVETKSLTLASQVKTTKKADRKRGIRNSLDKPVKEEKTSPLPVIVNTELEDTTPLVGERPRKRARKLLLPPPKPISSTPRWSNGWNWAGQSYDAKVYITNDDGPVLRRCYPAMRHAGGDTIQPRDCVLLKAGARKSDLPFVAKVSALWENPEDGEMMISLLWYYRPEHTDQGRRLTDQAEEIFASRHRDVNSVACIEDKCYVLTFNEYCRYWKYVRAVESGVQMNAVMPGNDEYPWKHRLPPGIVAPELVLFCRKVYDFRRKGLLKNPS